MEDFIPLARAAALAHQRLFPAESVKDAKALDLVALALSTLLPLYQRDMESGALRALGEAEVARGRFTRGATRLECAGRPPLRFLVVSRAEMALAIEALARQSLSATSPLLRGLCRRPRPVSSSSPGA